MLYIELSSVLVFQPEEIKSIVEHFLGRLKMIKESLERSQSESSAGPSNQSEIEIGHAIDQTVDLTRHFLNLNLRNNFNVQEFRAKIRKFFESKARDIL